jgi:hypothetical protein
LQYPRMMMLQNQSLSLPITLLLLLRKDWQNARLQKMKRQKNQLTTKKKEKQQNCWQKLKPKADVAVVADVVMAEEEVPEVPVRDVVHRVVANAAAVAAKDKVVVEGDRIRGI